MGKIKTGLLAVGATVVGAVTLRKFRKRRSKATTDDETSAEVAEAEDELEASKEDLEDATDGIGDAKEEAITAAKHAAGAVKHTGLAAGKAVKATRQKAETDETTPETAESK